MDKALPRIIVFLCEYLQAHVTREAVTGDVMRELHDMTDGELDQDMCGAGP